MPLELHRAGGLALIGLVAPLVALYLLRVRRRRVTVPSTWLWAEAQRELQARSPLRRLVLRVPLLLETLAVLLLAGALARPVARGAAIPGDHVALILDASASMLAATGDGSTRQEAALRLAEDVLEGLGPGARAMIVEAGASPRVVAPLDRDRQRLRASLASVRAQEIEGHLGGAVALANDRLRSVPGVKRLIVITDGALTDPESLRDSSLPLQVMTVGSPADNAAIVRIDVRIGRDPVTQHEQLQAFVLVRNFGTAPRDLFVTLRQHNVDQPLASRRLQLAPRETAPCVMTFEPTTADYGSGLVVEISPSDALSIDDRAFARVPPGRQIPVVLAPGTGSPWIRRALTADPGVELAATSLSGLHAAGVPSDALVVVEGACPTAVPGSELVVLNPPPGPCRGLSVGEVVDHPTITSWARGDARFRFLSLDGVLVHAARPLKLESPRTALVQTSQGPIVADLSSPGRTDTVVSFDVGESNWPLQASFVLFVRNLVDSARSRRVAAVPGTVRTGAPSQAQVPSDVAAVQLQHPGGTLTRSMVNAGLVLVPPLTRAGIYHLSWQGKQAGSILWPVNLTSAKESDLRPAPLSQDYGRSHSPSSDGIAAHAEWDWLLAILALGFITLDIWWLTRRTRMPRTSPLPSTVPDSRWDRSAA